MITLSDKRTPLPQYSQIESDTITYLIKDIVGFGGSCIAYLAERRPNEYESSIGMPPTPAIIKEFYPLELVDDISRTNSTLTVDKHKQSDFHNLKRRFERGAVNQALFFTKDSDHSFAPTRIIPANGTVYSVVDSVQGEILPNACRKLEMYEIAQIIKSLTYAVKALHDDGKLHLDIKPSNIFLFNRNSSESRRIALFDFDTITPINEIYTSVIPFSDGWSPYEQTNQHRDKISYSTDIYSIGAVFYWLISGGEKVSDNVLDLVKRQNFDFINEFDVLMGKESPRNDVRKLLSATLKREPSERAQSIKDLYDVK